MSLKEYIRKRDFKKTNEPKGRKAVGAAHDRFVIQKHAASRLHYDFRLEMGGTLKSWAVPKGVPFVKGEKRLAVQVEDHPVSYINFEGVIPQGQYGGGTVMVWDRGTFEPLSDAPAKELAGGKLHFQLHGQKLNGEWYLVQLRHSQDWLLIKGGTDARPVSAKKDDTSALSGKSMRQLAEGKRVWRSNRTQAAKEPVVKKIKAKRTVSISGLKFVEPMKARLVSAVPAGDWVYEIKFDGFRALALKNGAKVTLLSRNEKEFNEKFPEVVDALSELDAESAVIDGEIVALDPQGRSSFQLLQAYDLGEERPPIFFYAFDLLQLDGQNLSGKPLTVRKRELQNLLRSSPQTIRFSASLVGKADALLQRARKMGLEGLIGKRADSKYESGKRTGAWIKLKLHQEQEMVIGGYTDPTGQRQHFGALLIGYYKKKQFYFAGKVGTGFNDARLSGLHAKMGKLSQSHCPFVNLPEKSSGRYSSGATASQMAKCHWVKPKLVCQVKFSEWTRDGKLRQPVFLGLRDDKNPLEVVREVAK